MAREREECGHHSRDRLSPEEYQARAAALIQRVTSAVRLADGRLRSEPGYVGSALANVEVWGGIPKLDVDVIAVIVPKPSGAGRLFLAFMWDWLDAHTDEDIANSLVASIRKAAAEALASEAEPGAAPDPAT